MKKTILFLLLTAITVSSAYAQNYIDALRYSQYFYEGTARSSAMGNALTAVGGDLGALSVNPAASGVYRHGEFIITPSLTNTSESALYSSLRSQDDRSRFGISSLGYVGNISSSNNQNGLVRLNYSVGANKTNNFTSRSSIIGHGINTSWLASLAVNTGGIDAREMDMTHEKDDYPFRNSGASWAAILAWNTCLLDTLPDGGPKAYIAAIEDLDGYDIYQPNSLNQRMYSQSSGNITEYYINIGGNVSNKFFFGATLTYQSIWYEYYERYTENSINPQHFQTGFRELTHTYNQSASGSGVNLKLGLIFLPVSYLRLGASLSTPTLTTMNEEWRNQMSASFIDDNFDASSPLGKYRYKLRSPMRVNLGAAVTIPKVGLISVDYENVDYRNIKMIDIDNSGEFGTDNYIIERDYKSVNNLRIGTEFILSDYFLLRAGYNYYDSPYRYSTDTRHIASGGLGFKSTNGFFVDLAVQLQTNKSTSEFTFYDKYATQEPPLARTESNYWRVLMTLGMKF